MSNFVRKTNVTGRTTGRVSKEILLREAKKKKKPHIPHAQSQKALWARLSVVSNGFLLILKLAVGIYISSISVISEGLHTGIDLLAALLAAYSVHKAVQPADKEHKYGHGKFENVSGTLEAIMIFAVGLVIIYEASLKIVHYWFIGITKIDVDLGIGVMFISLIVNILVSRKLHQVAREHDSIAIEADAYHLSADVWTSLGVLAGLMIIWVGNYFNVLNIEFVDPIFAIIIAIIIIKTSWDLTKRSMPGLLDGSLPENEEKIIHNIIRKHYSSFVDYHDFRSRKAGAERHIDLHLVVARNITVGKAHEICQALIHDIEQELSQTKVIVQFEPCEEKCSGCKLIRKENGECEEKPSNKNKRTI